MTPQFTTSCYVRITDKDKRKEVCDKIEPVGYKIKVDYTEDINPIVVASKLGILYDASSFKGVPDFIDCGTNIPLFLDLVGMRSDTDKGQWFLRIDTKEMGKCNTKDFSKSKLRQGFWRKATAQEIIEWHKQKGETK